MNPTLATRFGSLVALNRAAMLGHALRLTRNRDEAEDLTQKAILRAAGAFVRFDGDNFRAWTLTIVTNLHINERKRLARTSTASLEDENEAADPNPSPLERLWERNVSPEVLEAIGELPRGIGRTFMLTEFAGLTHNEAASAEGVPVGTIRSRLFRARAFLRERLADYAREEHGVVV